MVAIGIDLGTTNSCVAYARPDGSVDVIANRLGKHTTPSAVAFIGKHIYFGTHALECLKKDSKNVVYGLKYLIGRKFTDDNVQKHIKYVNYDVSNHNDNMYIGIADEECNTKLYRVEELTGIFLKELRTNAEEYLDKLIETAVITVPTYFDDTSRQATIDAGKIAGFKNVHLLNEPTAAALAYKERFVANRTILVFDMGGGTFDISILRLRNYECTVLGIDGDLHLGGDDIDKNVLSYLIEEMKSKHDYDITGKKHKIQYFKRLCEQAKINLSSMQESDIELVELDATIELTRDKFNELNLALFQTCINIMKNCLKRINMTKEEIDAVLLIGGSTRNCYIRDEIAKYFGNIKYDINPDEAVAIGAAYKAASHSGDALIDTRVSEVSAYSLGTEILPEGTFRCLIPKYSKLPIREFQHGQIINGGSSTTVKIYTGESKNVKDNNLVGKFKMRNVHRNPEGKSSFTIKFQLDDNGVLEVNGYDHQGSTGSTVILLEKGTLSVEEIREMSEKIEKLYIEKKKK